MKVIPVEKRVSWWDEYTTWIKEQLATTPPEAVCKIHIISIIDIIDNHNTFWMCDKCGARIWQNNTLVNKHSSFWEQRRRGCHYHISRDRRQMEILKWTEEGMMNHEGSDTSIILYTPDEMYVERLGSDAESKRRS